MARISKKEDINEYIQKYYKLHWNCLTHQNHYKEDYKKYIQLIRDSLNIEKEVDALHRNDVQRNKLIQKWRNINDDIAGILSKYNTQTMPAPDIPLTWTFLYGEKSLKRVTELDASSPTRFGEILFSLDYQQNVDVLFYELKKKIEQIKQSPEIRIPYEKLYTLKKREIQLPTPCVSVVEKNNQNMIKVFIFKKTTALEKDFRKAISSLNIKKPWMPLNSYERYFAVWDKIKENPNLPYGLIVKALTKKGFYPRSLGKGRADKKDVIQAIDDFEKAKILLKVSEKYKKPSRRKTVDSPYSEEIIKTKELLRLKRFYDDELRKAGYEIFDFSKNLGDKEGKIKTGYHDGPVKQKLRQIRNDRNLDNHFMPEYENDWVIQEIDRGINMADEESCKIGKKM